MTLDAQPPMAKTEDFSLVVGGAVYQLLIRIGLVRPPLDRVGWRMCSRPRRLPFAC
jgi:hypothetical protein